MRADCRRAASENDPSPPSAADGRESTQEQTGAKKASTSCPLPARSPLPSCAAVSSLRKVPVRTQEPGSSESNLSDLLHLADDPSSSAPLLSANGHHVRPVLAPSHTRSVPAGTASTCRAPRSAWSTTTTPFRSRPRHPRTKPPAASRRRPAARPLAAGRRRLTSARQSRAAATPSPGACSALLLLN